MNKKKSQQNTRGSALIPVLCVLFLIMALILSMTLAAYQVTAHVYEYATKEQCRVTTISHDSMVKKQLEQLPQTANGLSEQFASMIQSGNWSYYNKSEEGHNDKEAVTKKINVNYYDTGNMENKMIPNAMGKVEVSAYWEFDQTNQDSVATNPSAYRNVNLVITIKTILRKQSYAITSEYTPKISGEDWMVTTNWSWAKS